MIAKRENITKEGVYSYKPYRKEQTVIGSCDKTEPFCKMTPTDILGLLTDLTVKGVVPGTAAQSVEGVPSFGLSLQQSKTTESNKVNIGAK